MIKYAFPRACFALMILSGCDRTDSTSPQPDAAAAKRNEAVVEDVTRMESDIRLAVATKRIDALEAEVDALKVNPQTLDTAMLQQRLATLETAVYARGDDRPTPAAESPKTASSGVPVITKPTIARKAPPTPKTAKLATKAEAEAFAKGN